MNGINSVGSNFYVTYSAREVGISNPVIAVYTNINPMADSSVYDSRVKAVLQRIPEFNAKKLAAPEVIGYRNLYTRLSYPNVETAGERLLRITSEKGFRRHGPLVDSYNMVALSNVEGLGCHDVSSFPKDFTLFFKRALGDEEIHVDIKKKKKITPGDLTYGVREGSLFTPLAWLGKQDKDNARYRLNEETTAMMLTAIGNAETSLDYNVKVCQDVYENIKLSSPDAKMELRIGQFIADSDV